MIHENLEGKCFGTIDFNESMLENTFGLTNIKSIGACSLHVYANEGTKPHFHLICKEAKFHCCIRLDCNYYFPHQNYRGTLNSRQRKELNDFLDTIKYFKDLDITASIWKAMSIYWNLNKAKEAKEVNIDNKPDYSTMTNFKEN